MIFRNLGNGKFEELIDGAGPAFRRLHSSRGCAFGDFDNDGDIDVLIMNMNEPPSLLRNDLQQFDNPPALDQSEADRHEVESQRHRIAGHRLVRRQTAGAGSDGAIELLLGERFPPAFRTRCGRPGGLVGALDQWPSRRIQRALPRIV